MVDLAAIEKRREENRIFTRWLLNPPMRGRDPRWREWMERFRRESRKPCVPVLWKMDRGGTKTEKEWRHGF